MSDLIQAVTVGGATYNVAQASAEQQKKLLLLTGGKIAMHSAAGKVEKIDDTVLFGSLITMPEHVFDEIATIVLHKTIKSGEKTNTSIIEFQGRQVEYFTLVAKAIAVNLNDFFTYLDSVNANARAQRVPTTTR